MNDYKIVPDSKNDIKFWLDALSNPNIDRDSKEMLNKCLYFELKNYLYPPEYISMCMGKPMVSK